MRYLSLSVSALFLVVAGCATDSSLVAKWSKPGASLDDFMKARQACIDEARAQSGGYYIGGVKYKASSEAISAGAFIPCMGAHGFARDPNGFTAPEGDEVQMGP